VIRFDSISKIYATDLVLKNINWEIKNGEKIGLVGSNGAGKTTQLKILIGDEEQTSGYIIKEGNPKIAYLKQEFNLQHGRTVSQELASSFSDIQKVSDKLNEVEKKLKNINNLGIDNDLQSLVRELGLHQREFEALGGYQMQSKIEKLLPKLGFTLQNSNDLVETFSGGWQMKIALGKIMLQEPDLILLDEPTNHLDLDTIVWLEEYLISLKISIILISHDRYFLDKICNKIVFVNNGISKTYKGNYSDFIQQKNIEEEIQEKQYSLQKKEIESQKKFIDKFRASATRSSQAKSREKKINKIQRIERVSEQITSSKFNFPESPRSGKLILKIKKLSHEFGNQIIFFDADLDVFSGDKIAFLGPNGSGKSTLLKLIMKQITPELGEINLGKHNVITSYYEQNQSQALDLNRVIIDLLFSKAPNWSQKEVRTFLAGFGFNKDSVFKTVGELSGGEKAKLALSLMLIKPCNFLLLDEPTNHLDLKSKENLESALINYKGTSLIISHDRYFISRVANKVVEIRGHKLIAYNGNYNYYLQEKLKNK
tara:strand:- start:7668 stop:9290 length:1623 start_codon:yes stop_codon:yes gene_type:complete